MYPAGSHSRVKLAGLSLGRFLASVKLVKQGKRQKPCNARPGRVHSVLTIPSLPPFSFDPDSRD